MKFLIAMATLLIQLPPLSAQADSMNSIEVRKVSPDSVYSSVDEMPEFPGGHAAFLKYMTRVAYPDSAKENDIQGRVHVKYVISETGEVTNVEIEKSTAPALNETSLNHVRAMPRWKPGKLQGVPVKVQFVIPITFSLD